MFKYAPLMIGLLLSVFLFIPAQAASITVTTTVDELKTNGNCSLREAIRAANLDTRVDACPAGSGSDTISLPAGTFTLAIAGADEDNTLRGDLDIRSNLTIVGAGASKTILDGNRLDRLVDVHTGTVVIQGVTIQNGRAGDGGGVRNAGTLTLDSDTVRRNETHSWMGGGILNQETGKLSVRTSTITENVVPEDGGGIYNRGSMSIDFSRITYNQTVDGYGGGLLNLGTATITESTIAKNQATFDGGIYNRGTLEIQRSTINNNTTTNSGEDGEAGGIGNGGSLRLINSTVSMNRSAGHGGGLYNRNSITIQNSTIAHNVADNNNEDGGDGAGIFNEQGTVVMQNSILVNNRDNSGQAHDCAGTLTSNSYNLIRNARGCTITGDTTGNRLGIDPKIGPLQNNGGKTYTHMPAWDSPAVDTGNPGTVGSGGKTCTSTDQRNVSRPRDGNSNGTKWCDRGAVERRSKSTP